MHVDELQRALSTMTIVNHEGQEAVVLSLRVVGPARLVSDLELYRFDDESRTTGRRILAAAREVTIKDGAPSLAKPPPSSLARVAGYLKDGTPVFHGGEP